jgi:Cd2+/Zn2+-exporting ATPase
MIATPTATLAGIARGARGGVLFKGGQAIERLARLAAVAFDKTGTLTVGKMRVQALHPIGWSDERRLLAVAAGLEQDSTHPIAAAVRAKAEAEGVEPAVSKRPRAVAGRGVEAEFDGVPARLGTLVFVEELVPVCLRAQVRDVLRHVQQRGEVATVVVHNEQAGVIILSDTVRPGAERLVTDLHALGVKPVVMLTGDNRATAAAVAEQLGIDRFEAECLPEDKLRLVASLREEIHKGGGKGGVGVIGDGVNDAPALAAADVSIGIGSIGSDAALESADIVLLSDDLGVVPWAVGLARRTRFTIRVNLTLALGAIALMSIATLLGPFWHLPLPLWMGVLGHEGGTLLVVANSLLLLAHRSPRREAGDEKARVRIAANMKSRDAQGVVAAAK